MPYCTEWSFQLNEFRDVNAVATAPVLYRVVVPVESISLRDCGCYSRTVPAQCAGGTPALPSISTARILF